MKMYLIAEDVAQAIIHYFQTESMPNVKSTPYLQALSKLVEYKAPTAAASKAAVPVSEVPKAQASL